MSSSTDISSDLKLDNNAKAPKMVQHSTTLLPLLLVNST